MESPRTPSPISGSASLRPSTTATFTDQHSVSTWASGSQQLPQPEETPHPETWEATDAVEIGIGDVKSIANDDLSEPSPLLGLELPEAGSGLGGLFPQDEVPSQASTSPSRPPLRSLPSSANELAKSSSRLTPGDSDSTSLSITPLPRRERSPKRRNPYIAARVASLRSALVESGIGAHSAAYRSDKGITIHHSVCPGEPLETMGARVPQLVARAQKAGRAGARSVRRTRSSSVLSRSVSRGSDVAEKMRVGLKTMDWRSLVPVLVEVAGPLVDWRLAAFYAAFGHASKMDKPENLPTEVMPTLDRLDFQRIASTLRGEVERCPQRRRWKIGRTEDRSLDDTKVLRAVREAATATGLPEQQIRTAIDAYAAACSVVGKYDGRDTPTAISLARERDWDVLAGTLVGDIEFLSKKKTSTGPISDGLGDAVSRCRDHYFKKCSLSAWGRLQWVLKPENEPQSPSPRSSPTTQGPNPLSFSVAAPVPSTPATATASSISPAFAVAGSEKPHRGLRHKLERFFRGSERGRDGAGSAAVVDEDLRPCLEARIYQAYDPRNPAHNPARI